MKKRTDAKIRKWTTWRVRPGKVHVTKGDRVNFAPTNTSLVLWFGKKNLFGTHLITVPRQGKTLSVRTDKPGHYRYRVCCIEKGKFAHGSEPEMIVP